MKFVKKILIFAVLGGGLYFLLSYHFVIIGNKVKLLEKSTLTLNYTIFSTKAKTTKAILAVDVLREDGIGDLLVEVGKISEEELELLMIKYSEEDS